MKLLNLKLKKLLFCFENLLGFFIADSSDAFISLLIFAIVDYICLFTVSSDVFISPTFFAVTNFCYFVFVLLYR